jgi:Flp pilus assembly protein TadG
MTPNGHISTGGVPALLRTARRFIRSRRGLAGIEFGILASVFSVGLLNATDLAFYLFDQIQVENATEMGAQAAWQACDFTHIPATANCTGWSTAVTTAVHSTSLGSAITLVSGSPSEGYYCVNSSGALQYMSNTTSKPADCTAAGTAANSPGDYVKVQTTYTFSPLFGGLSVASILPTTISRTAWMRLG